jgi:predicted pyridoxine 5'-phosphate oxidase superfamily flavin-nucleotide-binding protein
MATKFARIEPQHRTFIAAQKIFFTASAAATSRVNVSPKSTDELRVLDDHTVVYRDLTGSGNETAAHLRANDRFTLMFCSFEGPATILRLYGHARVVRRGSEEYAALLAAHFADTERPGARQMVRLDVDLVQTSCGYGVPLFDYAGERAVLEKWALTKGEDGLAEYRREKNVVSIDGLPTGILERV